MFFSASSHLFKKVTLNAYPVSLKISSLLHQFKTVLGLITVEISPAINPLLVSDATLIILATFSFPLALFKFLFFAKTIAFDLTNLHILKAKIKFLNSIADGFFFDTILKFFLRNGFISGD